MSLTMGQITLLCELLAADMRPTYIYKRGRKRVYLYEPTLMCITYMPYLADHHTLLFGFSKILIYFKLIVRLSNNVEVSLGI